ncbi:MAG: hypothetical protein PVJ86_10115 [Phycisphaerales bacterium]
MVAAVPGGGRLVVADDDHDDDLTGGDVRVGHPGRDRGPGRLRAVVAAFTDV